VKIRFESLAHKYFDETGKELKSVTTLLKQHGLSPDYSCVDAEILKSAGKRGTLIHNEISIYIDSSRTGFTDECEAFIKYAKKTKIVNAESEVIVANASIAGTLDLIFESGNQSYLADIKTSSSIDYEYCAWQLSLYEYLSGRKFDKLTILHIKGDKLNAIDFTPYRKSNEEIENLLKAESLSVLYCPKMPQLPKLELSQIAVAEKLIKQIKSELETVEKQHSKLKESLIKAMIENGVKSFENETLKITYVSESVRESIDTKTLKSQYPDIAQKFIKTSVVKPSVRITLKEYANE
jgi:hypothetical protein